MGRRGPFGQATSVSLGQLDVGVGDDLCPMGNIGSNTIAELHSGTAHRLGSDLVQRSANFRLRQDLVDSFVEQRGDLGGSVPLDRKAYPVGGDQFGKAGLDDGGHVFKSADPIGG